jgi:hypothetical protein
MERTDAAPVRTAILDAGPIIHLDELGCLPLLSDFQELIVPIAVWQEVERHRPVALTADQIMLIKHKPRRYPAPFTPYARHSILIEENGKLWLYALSIQAQFFLLMMPRCGSRQRPRGSELTAHWVF